MTEDPKNHEAPAAPVAPAPVSPSSSPSPASVLAPTVWTVGGTMNMLAEREIAEAKADQARRLAESDAERANSAAILRNDADRQGMNGAIQDAVRTGKGLTMQRNMGGGQHAVIEIPVDESHVMYCIADVVVTAVPGTDRVKRQLVLVCPKCVERTKSQSYSQIHIDDSNRAWYIVDEGKGHLWVDTESGNHVSVVGRIEGPERMRCPRTITCGFSFRLSVTNTGHPAVTKMMVEGRPSRSKARRLGHAGG